MSKFAFQEYAPTRKGKIVYSKVGTRDNSPPEAMGNTARYVSEKYDEHKERSKPRLEHVPVSKLRRTQEEVEIPTVKHYTEHPPDSPIWGLKDPKSGKVHIADGHHRAEAAKARGDSTIAAEVYDEPGIDKV